MRVLESPPVPNACKRGYQHMGIMSGLPLFAHGKLVAVALCSTPLPPAGQMTLLLNKEVKLFIQGSPISAPL